MRSYIIVRLVFYWFLAMILSQYPATQFALASQPAAQQSEIEFALLKASCMSCQKQVENSLKKMPGVRTVTIIFGKKPRVLISFNSKQVTESQIYKQIRSLGYDAGPVEQQSLRSADDALNWLKQRGYKTNVKHIQMPDETTVK